MILYRVDVDWSDGDESDPTDPQYFLTLREARAFATHVIDDETGATISRCATNPKLRGARLAVAMINGRGWMASGSLIEIQRVGPPKKIDRPADKPTDAQIELAKIADEVGRALVKEKRI